MPLLYGDTCISPGETDANELPRVLGSERELAGWSVGRSGRFAVEAIRRGANSRP